jgi:hypothetical protein
MQAPYVEGIKTELLLEKRQVQHILTIVVPREDEEDKHLWGHSICSLELIIDPYFDFKGWIESLYREKLLELVEGGDHHLTDHESRLIKSMILQDGFAFKQPKE